MIICISVPKKYIKHIKSYIKENPNTDYKSINAVLKESIKRLKKKTLQSHKGGRVVPLGNAMTPSDSIISPLREHIINRRNRNMFTREEKNKRIKQLIIKKCGIRTMNRILTEEGYAGTQNKIISLLRTELVKEGRLRQIQIGNEIKYVV